MSKVRTAILAWNRGIVSKLGLARIDVRRLGFSAERMVNWMPRVLGSMMLRPGTEYIETTRESLGDSFPTVLIPFVFSGTETAMLEFSGNTSPTGDPTGWLRILIDDVVLTRPAVTAAITNGSVFNDLTGWTDLDEGGTAVSTNENVSPILGFMHLTGDGNFAAIREQEVTVNEVDTEHALTLTVVAGPLVLRVGSTSGGNDYIDDLALPPGTHSIAFTPSGNFFVRLSNRLDRRVSLSQIFVELAGAVELGTPYDDDRVELIRYVQSGDIVFLACDGEQQRQVMRWSDRSWSIAVYESIAGPFMPINATDVTLEPSGLSGSLITIQASAPIFREEHVGAQFRIASHGQEVSEGIAAEDTFTAPIRVVGVGDSRIFNVDISSVFTATVTIQFSVAEPGNWVDLATTYTAPTSTTIDDGLDNQIVYYRIGVKAGDYTSGTAICSLSIATGSINGIALITDFTSSTVLVCTTLRAFGGTDPSVDWWESYWSDYRGWPGAVTIHDGRLTWAGDDFIFGSVSDDYRNFDDEVVGDAGPIIRSIGFGPIQTIHWLLSLERLLVGTALNSANVAAAIIQGNSPISAFSSALDEPLTPSNFGLRAVSPVGLFVDTSKQRLYALPFDGRDYIPEDLCKFCPDLNSAGITRIAVQMKPDVRVHCVRADGTVGVVVFDRIDNVYAWVEVETDGLVEEVAVLPGDEEDQVYYVVKRTVAGLEGETEHRYVEKWAKESECQGGTLNKQADSFLEYSGVATDTITGLDHLEGKTVVAWGAGKDLGSYTVVAGSITLTEAVTSCIVGLAYTAQFKGTKLATIDGQGLCTRRNVTRLGVILYLSHYQGLRYGPDFDTLYELPAVEGGQVTADDTVWDELDEDTFPFGGTWDTDSRVCLQAAAPRPCTLLAAVMDIDA